ncbi:MAG: WYL domain-containing protein [Caulobacterales bacterium]|nr:WYL domain-containing protein [Caulobacterales bacterium]
MSKAIEKFIDLLNQITSRADGMTIEEIMEFSKISRRTAERMRDTIDTSLIPLEAIDLGDNRKHWRAAGNLVTRWLSIPNANELSALENEIVSLRNSNNEARALVLQGLLGKITALLNDKARDKAQNDAELLNKSQRIYVPAGPAIKAEKEIFKNIQDAILMGRMIEFEYFTEHYEAPKWRRIIPYGIIYGSISYVHGEMPNSKHGAHTYRIDKMSDVRISDEIGYAPEDFDLDEYMSQSFGLWQGAPSKIKLLALPHAAQKALNWRFHPKQKLTETKDGVLIEFEASGLYELALHLCSWAGEIKILEPQELRDEMTEIQSAEF